MKPRHTLVAVMGALALSGAIAGPASAGPALHGFCNGTGGGACVDNNTNTPLGNSTDLGFWLSSAGSTGASGTLTLDILLPDNYSAPSGFTILGDNGYSGGTATEFSSSPWETGTLAAYLGIAASPDNPIDAYLPTTDALDAGADGFYVYRLALTDVTLFNSGAQPYEFDAIDGLGGNAGAYIVAFFNTGTADKPACIHGQKGDECATANSAALLVTGTPSVPEPGSLALFATALAGLGLFSRLRRRA